MKNVLKVFMVLFGVAVFCSCSGDSSSKSSTDASLWPQKDITITVGFGAGGDADVVTRHLAEALSKKLGVNVIVNNVTGSNGAIACDEIMNTNNPEYSFLMVNTPSISANPVTGLTDYGYEAFESVAIFAKSSGETLYARADAPYNTLDEFVAYTKNNSVIMGVPMGGAVYAASVAMKESGLNINIVDSGDAPDRLTALLGKTIDCSLIPYTSGLDYVENGDLKKIATLCSVPVATDPDMPCVGDTINGVVIDSNFVIFAKKGTNKDIVEAFNKAIQEVYQEDSSYVQKIEKHTLQSAKPMTTAETLESLEAQSKVFQNYKQYL